MNDQIVLVDEHDVEIGQMPKLEVHQKGILHRAFSVFIFNTEGKLLLQQRAMGKYHSEGLWSNTCCSHPLPGEEPADAAVRRLQEEMGMTADLKFLHSFIYHARLDRGLTEHELDHIFWGVSDAVPDLNLSEVSAYRYAKPADIIGDMDVHPERYTEWFKICFSKVMADINL